MRINSINQNTHINKSPNFGHSFRVSICTKNAKGIYSFVNPAENAKLYKQLNKKIVGFLNEDFITNLRNTIGIPRKVNKIKAPKEIIVKSELTKKLSEIDSDYKQANFVRSTYQKSKLAHISTGADAAIINEFMGADNIGVVKNMTKQKGLPKFNPSVKETISEFQQKATEYVESPTQLLRSKDNKEVMLYVNFDEIKGKHGRKPKYQISEFNFQELKTKPLKPLTVEDKSIKKDINLNWVVGRFIKHSFDKIYDKTKSALSINKLKEVRNNFKEFASKKIDIKHDLPV